MSWDVKAFFNVPPSESRPQPNIPQPGSSELFKVDSFFSETTILEDNNNDTSAYTIFGIPTSQSKRFLNKLCIFPPSLIIDLLRCPSERMRVKMLYVNRRAWARGED